MLGLHKDGFEREKAYETYSSSNVFFFENIKYKNFKLRVFLFVYQSSTYIFNFGLFILEMITNLKPGEEKEDPERRYVE
ncbi:unnamed protein product [Brassica oleracea]